MIIYKSLKGLKRRGLDFENIVKFQILRYNNRKKYRFVGPYVIDRPDLYLKEYLDNCKRLKIIPDINRTKNYLTFNKNRDLNYITEEFYKYYIEPYLSLRRYSATIYQNKALMDYLPMFIDEVKKNHFAESYVKKICGIYYDRTFKSINCKIIDYINNLHVDSVVFKKNLDTGGGRDVFIFERLSNREFFCQEINKTLTEVCAVNTDFLIQERIIQNNLLATLNQTSLNTIRIITYRSVCDESIYILHAFVRFGGTGDLKDNNSANGGFSYVNDNGSISKVIMRRNFSIEKRENEILIPGFREIVSLACLIASKFIYHRIIGFDFAVASDNTIKVIEINPNGLNPEATNFLRGSFFNSFTSEVMNFVNQQRSNR